jgi:hypothetical protein
MSKQSDLEEHMYANVELEDILSIVENILGRYASEYSGEDETDRALAGMFREAGVKVSDARMMIVRNWLRLEMSRGEEDNVG